MSDRAIPFGRVLFFIALGVGLLSLLSLVAGSSLLILGRSSSTAHSTISPTTSPGATSMPPSTSTPLPSPTPEPPLVYLMAHGNPNLPEIALTFDDGPSPDYTKSVLDVLRHYHVLATFFMIGSWVERYPDLARAVVADGHAIGDHTWNHADLTQLSADQMMKQLSDTRDTIQRVTGYTTHLFRPPYMAYNRQVLDIAHSLKLSTILWSIDPHDYTRPGKGPIISTVLTNAQNGSVVLMHDGGGDRSQTIAALSTIIEQLQGRGFTFVTIPQMLQHLPPSSGASLAGQVAPSAHDAPGEAPGELDQELAGWDDLAEQKN